MKINPIVSSANSQSQKRIKPLNSFIKKTYDTSYPFSSCPFYGKIKSDEQKLTVQTLKKEANIIFNNSIQTKQEADFALSEGREILNCVLDSFFEIGGRKEREIVKEDKIIKFSKDALNRLKEIKEYSLSGVLLRKTLFRDSFSACFETYNYSDNSIIRAQNGFLTEYLKGCKLNDNSISAEKCYKFSQNGLLKQICTAYKKTPDCEKYAQVYNYDEEGTLESFFENHQKLIDGREKTQKAYFFDLYGIFEGYIEEYADLKDGTQKAKTHYIR